MRRVSATSLRRSRSALSAASPRRPGILIGADLHDACAKRDRRRPVRNRQRRPAELVAEGEGDIGLVERRVGGLRLGDHAIESGRIASRQRRPSEVHRPGAGEPLDQRRGTAPGRGEIERSPEAARESGPFDRDRVDGRRSGQRRRVAVATERRMAGGRASGDLHLEVVEIEPALVEAQRGREALRRESVGEVERSDLELDGGGRRAQRRWGEFRLRPARSRPARLGRPKRERQNAGHRQAVDGELAFDLRRRRQWRSRGSRPGAKRLLGAGDRGARLGGRRERRDGVIGQLAAGLDPGNRRRELRERPPIAAQGGVESNIGRSERAAVGGRKAERGRDRGKVRRLDLGGPKQLRVVVLRLRQEAAAPRQLRAGERRRRIDVVALRPSARRVERNMPAPASRRRRTQAELPQQRARVWRIEADGQSAAAVLRRRIERNRELRFAGRSAGAQGIDRRRIAAARAPVSLEGQRRRRELACAIDQNPAPFARRKSRNQHGEIAHPVGSQMAASPQSSRDPSRPAMSREAPPSPATLKRSRVMFGPLLTAFSDRRAAVDLRFADAGDMQRAGAERNRKVHVADHFRGGEARQRVDVERIGCEVEIEAASLAAGRTCEGERTGQCRSIQRQLEIASGEPGRRRFDLARQRGAAISERFADCRDLGHGLRRAEARPVAKQRKVGAAEINVAVELRRSAGVEIAFARNSALPRETEVEAQMQRRPWLGSLAPRSRRAASARQG